MRVKGFASPLVLILALFAVMALLSAVLLVTVADEEPPVADEPTVDEPVPQEETPQHLATANAAVIDDIQVGELLVDGTLVATLYTLTPDLTGFGRAEIASDRLNALFEGEFAVGDIQTLQQNGIWVLAIGDQSIATATIVDAEAYGTSAQDLAQSWRENLVTILFPEARIYDEEEDYETWENKIVPLVALGSGLRLGAVQVTGPKARVEECKAVVQLEGKFLDGKFRARALVPVGETDFKDIDRIPKVGVTGLVDVKL
jgi:hypothetical protein